VTGVIRELASPQEFVVASAASDATARTIAVVPTRALKQRTSYMAVLTDGIKNAAGGNVRGSLIYKFAQGRNALCVDGQSTNPALPAARACALEPLRQLVNSQEAAATAAGVAAGSIVMSWVATTQSITPTLQAVEAIVEARPAPATRVASTGMTLAGLGLGLPGVADVYIGTIDLPYYLSAPSDEQLTAPLTGYWEGAPGAYIPQCAAFGLDPTSTNLTACNPVPVAKSTQTVPLVMTLPNAASGRTRPASGWPLVIYQHGITRNRTDMFAIAGTLAARGIAVVAIDLPLHGITSTSNPFHVGNTPFAQLGAKERTFDLDVQDNTTGAPGSDGEIDSSGTYFINLSSLLTSRDNLRQGAADLLSLSKAAASMAGIDGGNVSFVGQSLGGIVGTVFLALDPEVLTGVFSVPGGGIARMLDGSPTFGPRIRAGLEQAGVVAGTPEYDSFMGAAQTAVDSGDPINFARNGTLLDPYVDHPGVFDKRILLQEVIGGGDVLPDQVIPNRVPGAPLSGTEPLIAALGLYRVATPMVSLGGIRGAARFLEGAHGSLLDPSASPAATAEMQGQMASMAASFGEVVEVSNRAILEQEP
jgi:pimeloyl-ACP methyl ester carboxylesterase